MKLAEYLGFAGRGQVHRVLADAAVTAALMIAIQDELGERIRLPCVPQSLLRAVPVKPRHRCEASVARFRALHGF